MSAYLIGQINIINEEAYKEYVNLRSQIIKKYSGMWFNNEVLVMQKK